MFFLSEVEFSEFQNSQNRAILKILRILIQTIASCILSLI